MSINRVIVSGNLTRDPEVRSTASGTPVMKFGIAVNERVKKGEQWEDYANFIDCTMFGARAESVSRFLSKGSKVAIEGRLRWSQWEHEGQKRSKVEIIVEEIEFMSMRSDEQPATYSAPSYSQPQYQAPVMDTSSSVYDEDIPF